MPPKRRNKKAKKAGLAANAPFASAWAYFNRAYREKIKALHPPRNWNEKEVRNTLKWLWNDDRNNITTWNNAYNSRVPRNNVLAAPLEISQQARTEGDPYPVPQQNQQGEDEDELDGEQDGEHNDQNKQIIQDIQDDEPIWDDEDIWNNQGIQGYQGIQNNQDDQDDQDDQDVQDVQQESKQPVDRGNQPPPVKRQEDWVDQYPFPFQSEDPRDDVMFPPGGYNIDNDFENSDLLWNEARGTWLYARALGRGGYGRVGLWIRLNDDNNIDDRVAVKECVKKPREWRDPLFWRRRRPAEITYHGDLKEVANSHIHLGHIVGFFGYRIIPSQRRYRLYLEPCDFGTLHGVLAHYCEAKLDPPWAWYNTHYYHGNAFGLQPRAPKRIPERFIWHIFLCLVQGCFVMRDGQLPHNEYRREDWKEIVHRDLKPDNILLHKRRQPQDKPGDVHWPCPYITDFGLAFDTLKSNHPSDNPSEYLGYGTPGFRPPEQQEWYHEKFSGVKMDSRTNIWGVGAIIWCMITQEIHGPKPDVFQAPPLDEIQAENYGGLNILSGEFFQMAAYYSKHLKNLVRSCLSYHPQDRPTLEQLREEIDPWFNPYPLVPKDPENAGIHFEELKDFALEDYIPLPE